jgi:hypothetical protein
VNGGFQEFGVNQRAARVAMVRIGTSIIKLVWAQLTLLCAAAALE